MRADGPALAILHASTRGFLATRSADDRPAVHPLSVFFRDDAVWLNTYLRSAKARNMLRSPAVGVLVVEAGQGPPRPPGVLVRGRIEMLPPDARLPAATRPPAYALAGMAAPDPHDPAWSRDGRRRWFRLPLTEVTLLEVPGAPA